MYPQAVTRRHCDHLHSKRVFMQNEKKFILKINLNKKKILYIKY